MNKQFGALDMVLNAIEFAASAEAFKSARTAELGGRRKLPLACTRVTRDFALKLGLFGVGSES